MDHKVAVLAQLLTVLTVMGSVVVFGIYKLEDMRRRSRAALNRSPVDDDRIARLEAAVESMSHEMQRLTEAQEFQQRLLEGERSGRKDSVGP